MEHREPEEGGEKLSLSAHRLKVIVFSTVENLVLRLHIPHAREHRTSQERYR